MSAGSGGGSSSSGAGLCRPGFRLQPGEDPEVSRTGGREFLFAVRQLPESGAVRVVKQRHDDPVQIGAAAPHCRSRQPSVLEVSDLLGTEFVLGGGNGPHQDQPLPVPG